VGIDDGCTLTVGEVEGTRLRILLLGELEGRRLGDDVLVVDCLESVGAMLLMSSSLGPLVGDAVAFGDTESSFLVTGDFSRCEIMRATTIEAAVATMSKPSINTARLIACRFAISFTEVCFMRNHLAKRKATSSGHTR
jgi:hypothetical protein